MVNPRLEVIDTARRMDLTIEEFSSERCHSIREAILSKFVGVGSKWPRWIWEHLVDAHVTRNNAAWTRVGELIGPGPVLLMFDPADNEGVVQVGSGEELVMLLAESFGFEFYVTNPDVEFFICFNHHDVLVVCGAAKERLLSIMQTRGS